MNLKYKQRNIINNTSGVKYFVVVLAMSITTVILGCQKYLDIKPNSQIVLIETANDAQLLLNNYVDMNTAYPTDGESSSDDYYLANDSYNSSSNNITDEDRNIYTWQSTAIRALALPQWQNSYYVVYNSNLVLETADKLKGKENDAVLNSLKGQALFFRAYAFWNIAQLYCKPYSASTADNDPGIPLRLNSSISDKSSRGSVSDTYKQIINDLNTAVTLLDPTTTVVSRPNKTAAYAMLARVYLSMEDYTNAFNNANTVIQLKNDLMDYNSIDTASTNTAPFMRFNKEVIFQSLIYSSPLLDPASETTPTARIPTDLYNSYAAKDLRKYIFFKGNSVSDTSNNYVFDGTYRFTGNYDGTSGTSQFNGLAVDEIYLIRAECNARKGNVASAMSDLNTLLSTRWMTGSYVNMTASSADDALVKILNERRKELVMRSQRWTDLRRLNKDARFAKTLTRTVNGINYTLPPNDSRYTLLIPQEVITNAGYSQNIR